MDISDAVQQHFVNHLTKYPCLVRKYSYTAVSQSECVNWSCGFKITKTEAEDFFAVDLSPQPVPLQSTIKLFKVLIFNTSLAARTNNKV